MGAGSYSGPVLRAVLLGLVLLSAQAVLGEDRLDTAAPAVSQDTPTARRVTDALNLLESPGYAEFDNFHEEGPAFAADGKLDGKPARLMIDPATRQIRVSER